jgi:hypothetical protein
MNSTNPVVSVAAPRRLPRPPREFLRRFATLWVKHP